MIKTTPKYNQCLMDISTQELGGIEGVFMIAGENGISITEGIEGMKLNIPKGYINQKIAVFYKNKRIETATKDGAIATFDFGPVEIVNEGYGMVKNKNTVMAQYGQSLPDLTVLETGSFENIFECALLNGLSIDEIPTPGAFLKVVSKPRERVPQNPMPVFKIAPTLVAGHLQNIQDLTIQTAGSLENIFEMAMLNGISVTETPTPGEKYKAVETNINSDIVNYYVAKKIIPATGLKWIPQQLFENGLFENGLFE